MAKRWTAVAAVAVAVASLVLVPASAAHAETPGCAAFAQAPEYIFEQNLLWAAGGRNGCSEIADVEVLIREDIPFWPDRTLTSGWGQGLANPIVRVDAPCSPFGGPIKVYTETRTSQGQKVQSARWWAPCDTP